MQTNRNIFISQKENIRHALIQLGQTKKKCLICVGDNDEFVGVVVDGDIRRCLIDGHGLDDSIHLACNKTPIKVSSQIRPEEAESLLSERIQVIPVVDANNIVTGYYAFKEKQPYMNIKTKRITILGMGYVGLTLGLTLAEQGFRVHGFDIDPVLIDQLNRCEMPFYEVGLERALYLHMNKGLTCSGDIRKCQADVYIITVGTPLLPQTFDPNTSYLQKAVESIGPLLEKGDLVILRSTVPIGSSREIALTILEHQSGMTCGEDFYLACAPERTAEGVALKELQHNPQIIGAFDPVAFELCARIFNTFTPSVINVGSLESAEFSKLLDNTFRDYLFAYSNMVALLAENLGLNVHDLIDAVNFSYSRNMIAQPSPGVGGPCLSKDPYIFFKAFENAGLNGQLLFNSRKINESVPHYLKNKLGMLLEKAGKSFDNVEKVSLIGMAFKGKPETSDLRDSTSVLFLETLPWKDKIYAYDPVVADDEIKALGITPVSLKNAFKGADAVIILNNHESYAKWNLKALLKEMNLPGVFLDTWCHFNPLSLKQYPQIVYGGLGND